MEDDGNLGNTWYRRGSKHLKNKNAALTKQHSLDNIHETSSEWGREGGREGVAQGMGLQGRGGREGEVLRKRGGVGSEGKEERGRGCVGEKEGERRRWLITDPHCFAVAEPDSYTTLSN